MLIKDTEKNCQQPGWFMVNDIGDRAEKAYELHQELFDSVDHQTLVAQVEQVLRCNIKSWGAVYITCRKKTAKRPANSEVKFGGIVLGRNQKISQIAQEVQKLGIPSHMIIYKPATDSLSVHVV
jgi:hypothetical protein